jgi:hypothetical protein
VVANSVVEISLLTDGTAAFGARDLSVTVDTTASGADDVQILRVVQGPASLYVRSTAFSDGLNVWALGATNGPNRVVWEYSANGTVYTPLTAPDMLSLLAAGVPVGGLVSVYFRLTMPTVTSSNNQHSAAVTIVAVPP